MIADIKSVITPSTRCAKFRPRMHNFTGISILTAGLTGALTVFASGCASTGGPGNAPPTAGCSQPAPERSCGGCGCCEECRADRSCCGKDYVRSLDEKHVERAARKCAEDAFERLEDSSRREYSSDFEDGFEQAYVDIADGHPPALPAIPPEKYWMGHFRSCEGKAEAHQWFAGYQAGINSAVSCGLPSHTRVATSLPHRDRSAGRILHGHPTTAVILPAAGPGRHPVPAFDGSVHGPAGELKSTDAFPGSPQQTIDEAGTSR